MPIPPPPGGPPSPPTFSQASSAPPLLSAEGAPDRHPLLSAEGAPDRHPLLSDLLLSSRLRTASLVNDRSAPMLDSKSQTQTDHPYIRLYQYLQQPHGQQGAPENTRTTFELEKPKRGGAAGANGSAAGSPSGAAPPIGGLFPGGAPKLRAVGDGSSGRSPSSRSAAPRPPSHRHDDAESPSPQTLSPLETSRPQPSSLPILTPPPPLCRRGNAPSPPSSNNREKTLPPTNTPPIPSKPPPSPGNSRRPPTSGGNPAPSSSLAPPPDLPQRHNSLNNKRPAPSPGGHTPTRGPAPPPPPSPSPNRPPPPSRETAGRGAAPPVPAQPSAASLRGGAREAPPPPPYRTHGSPSPSCDPPSRVKPPPPPPPLRNGTSSSPSVPRSFVDDFESKYSFHPLDDFPPPEEYRHLAKIYPSKANRVMRGAPPLPPVGR